MKIFKTHINEISIGSLAWLSKSVMATDLTHAVVGIPLFGVIGFDWMQDKKAVIDFSNNCLFIKP